MGETRPFVGHRLQKMRIGRVGRQQDAGVPRLLLPHPKPVTLGKTTEKVTRWSYFYALLKIKTVEFHPSHLAIGCPQIVNVRSAPENQIGKDI